MGFVDTSRQPTLFTDAAPQPWDEAADAGRLVAEVVIDRPLEQTYYYVVPDELHGGIAPGVRVRVPFGAGDRLITGFCVGLGTQAPGAIRLKAVREVLDRQPLLSPEMLELTRWIGERYLCGWGQVLNAVVPAGVRRKAGTREIAFYAAAPGAAARAEKVRLPVKQRAVLQVLVDAGGPL